MSVISAKPFTLSFYYDGKVLESLSNIKNFENSSHLMATV
jgi:hypothetical protein